jgi:hypothetical protein
MADRLESSDHATGPDAPADTGRPDHVPEKFWDAEKGEVRTEDLLKSYGELEKKSSSGLPSDDGTPAEGEDPQPTEGEDPKADDAAEKAAEAAGVDMDALETEFMAEGKLTDESYADLEAKGFSKDEVDDFIHARMADWASNNWTADELKEYNDAVDSYEMGRAKLAMKGLRADYEKANGRAPKLLDGDGSPPKGGTIYRSDAEMQRDMQDPRYREDPAFRDDVINKVERSMKHYGQA